MIIAGGGICCADSILALQVAEEHLRFPCIAGIRSDCRVQTPQCQGFFAEFFGIGEIGAAILKQETVSVFLTLDFLEFECWSIIRIGRQVAVAGDVVLLVAVHCEHAVELTILDGVECPAVVIAFVNDSLN